MAINAKGGDARYMERAMENREGCKLSASGSTRRTISVRACGEVACPPDIVQFTVTVFSSKEALEAAHASVKRRADYILQALGKNGIKERDVTCSTQVNPAGHSPLLREAAATDGLSSVQTDILVQANSLPQTEAARNLLLQKLDPSVRFTPLTFLHTAESKEGKRQEAFRKAIANAKSKAHGIAQTVGMKIGPALEVSEESQDCTFGSGETPSGLEAEPDSNGGAFRPSSRQRYLNYTRIYVSNVHIVFEALSPRTCSHKNCPKH